MSTESREPLPKEWEYLPDEKKALLRHGIGARLRLLIVSKLSGKKVFEQLERLTDVSQATWRTWWRREGTPSGKLIEAAARAWPENAFWLATGLTDVEAGHNLPAPPHSLARPYIDTYPESPFSAVTYETGHASWAGLTEDPNNSLSKWKPGASEFIESTAEYLRLCRDLQDDFWERRDDKRAPSFKTRSMEMNRMAVREERWKYAPCKAEEE